MTAPALERRSVRRFAVSYTGELASGSSVERVLVSDVSFTGCGIEFTAPSSEITGCTGVLSIRGVKQGSGAIMLPVTIANQRFDGEKSRVGLQFRRLSKHQVRELLCVLEKAIEL